MSDLPKDDEFDKDYWFEMYQGQCATTDEWAKKYREEIERKADATLLARCDELQRIAEVANAMVGKSRDQIETQAKRIAELEADNARLRVDGTLLDNERAVNAVSWTLCLQDGCDEDSARNLIWQGQPPEPYGEVWQTYEAKAREVLKAAIDAAKESA